MLGSYIAGPTAPPRYETLPGAGFPTPPDSPIKIAGHYLHSLKRPSRLRGRLIITSFAFLFLIFIFTARKHQADIQQYVSERLNRHFYEEALSQTTRWQDDEDPNLRSNDHMNPNFHLLIKARTSTFKLCQTVLSAAILNYPPPTLIGHDLTEDEAQMESSVVQDIYSYLQGKETHDDDMVLIIDDNTWLQLPSELMISRFQALLTASDARLLKRYGTERGATSSKTGRQHPPQPPKYTQKIVFGASKVCASNSTEDLACSVVPSSTLPNDIYGEDTDEDIDGIHHRPRYLDPSHVIGRAADLQRLYGHASEKLKQTDTTHNVGQYILSDTFGNQEAQRELERKSTISSGTAWREWLSEKLGTGKVSTHQLDRTLQNITAVSARSRDFGIGVDYESSVFQLMKGSASDVHFISFNQATMVKSPSKIAANTFSLPLQVPDDLNSTTPPFKQVHEPRRISTLEALELDRLPLEAQWTDVPLATNVIVPGSSVPMSLGFTGEEDLGHNLWHKMWYQPHSRALLRRYMRSPQGKMAAEAAADGGDQWWDLRGGKGGVWTAKGEWYEWNEMCGDFDDALFGDGKGSLGAEEEGVDGPVYNSFGKLMAGKEKDDA